MAERSTNTIAELFQRIMKDLGQFKLSATPEELPVIQELEDWIIQKNSEPIEQMTQQGLLPGAGQMDPMMQAMANAGPAPGGPSFEGSGGVRGVPTAAPPLGNVDELRRMLSR